MKYIPLFPLEIVVFPGEQLNLHIFEPRYKQLILDCQRDDLIFGIPFYQKGRDIEYGSTVQLEKIVKTYPNGSMDINTIGLNPIAVKRFVKKFSNKLYPGGYIEELLWDKEGDLRLVQKIIKMLKELYEYMDIKSLPKHMKDNFITFDIGHKIGFNQIQEYNLLQIPGEVDRQEYVINHLSNLIPKVMEIEEMRKKIQMNGHFKNILPPNL